jgi:hypothetical protein
MTRYRGDYTGNVGWLWMLAILIAVGESKPDMQPPRLDPRNLYFAPLTRGISEDEVFPCVLTPPSHSN